jgi:putative NADPH-quinone reductase
MRVLIIDGHPRPDSFCAGLADSFAGGAQSVGHPVRLIYARDLLFDLNARDQPLEPDLAELQEHLLWSEHLVLVYPTWWGTMPALLKGLLDRTFTSGFAFQFRPEGGWRPLLGGRSGQLITTMDTPPWIYRWLLGAPGTRALRDATLGFCGIAPVGVITLSPIHSSSPAERAEWLDLVKRTSMNIERDFRTGPRPRRRAWIAAARLQFYLFPWMALTAGALAAIVSRGGGFQLAPYLLACAAAVLIEFITVLTNDLNDAVSDKANSNAGPFTGAPVFSRTGDLPEATCNAGESQRQCCSPLQAAVSCSPLLVPRCRSSSSCWSGFFSASATPLLPCVLRTVALASSMSQSPTASWSFCSAMLPKVAPSATGCRGASPYRCSLPSFLRSYSPASRRRSRSRCRKRNPRRPLRSPRGGAPGHCLHHYCSSPVAGIGPLDRRRRRYGGMRYAPRIGLGLRHRLLSAARRAGRANR